MFPFTAFTHVCATPRQKIPIHAHNKKKGIKSVYLLVRPKVLWSPEHTESPLCYERYFVFPRQKRWHHWSHLMCALNIRWGRKGSIQEFSTLLRAPGLLSPSQPSQATLRTRTGWNRPPSPQQQQHKQPQLRVHWLETKQCMIAKPCLRPLGFSHRSSSAPPSFTQRFLPQKPDQEPS